MYVNLVAKFLTKRHIYIYIYTGIEKMNIYTGRYQFNNIFIIILILRL